MKSVYLKVSMVLADKFGMKIVCLYSYVIFFTVIASHNLDKTDERHGRLRNIASSVSCRDLITPFIMEIKLAKSYEEIFEKGYLSIDEVNEVRASSMLKTLIEKNSISGEDRDFAYAVLALIKKKHPRLSDESAALHYEAILRFCI